MRLMVGYGVWQKVDMMSWLLSGIAECFAPDTEVAIYFDACTDGSQDAFAHMQDYWLINRGFRFTVDGGSQPVFESGCHLALIQRFLASTCDLLLVAQDDQRFAWQHLDLALNVLFNLDDRIGVVGGRDGFGTCYGDFWAAEHSQSIRPAMKRLAAGEQQAVQMVNSGPIVYSRRLLKTCGLPDPEMRFYCWEEYSARATRAGLKNYVMDMGVEHAKFGRVTASTIYQPEISARDLARFRERHPGWL